MTERLLQFIWQSQYLSHHDLRLQTGELLHVLSPGEINVHQGPDFLRAGIRIGETAWFGNIELHLRTSGWRKHAHEEDSNYNNVILHVVWEDEDVADAPKQGRAAKREGIGRDGGRRSGDGKKEEENERRNIPVLVLKDRVSKLLLGKYEEWMKSRTFVACGSQLPREDAVGNREAAQTGGEIAGRGMKEEGDAVNGMDELWRKWKEKLLAERMARRTAHIRDCLKQNNQHWEETAWWLMARNFGIPVNAEAFEAVARSLPSAILAKHRDRTEQLEALLLGQAGLLEKDFSGDYPRVLQKEFRYLRSKYRLQPIHVPVHFLRMRPANFPTIRLAQLAAVLQGPSSWLALTLESASPEELKDRLSVRAGGYWDTHYLLGERLEEPSTGRRGEGSTGREEEASNGRQEEASCGRRGEGIGKITGDAGRPGQPAEIRPKIMGTAMKDSILINTLIPLLYAYGLLRGRKPDRDKAMRWLEDMKAEKNSVLAEWNRLGIGNRHAAESQALLELKKHYCDPKKCLQCAIGKMLLGRAGAAGTGQ